MLCKESNWALERLKRSLANDVVVCPIGLEQWPYIGSRRASLQLNRALKGRESGALRGLHVTRPSAGLSWGWLTHGPELLIPPCPMTLSLGKMTVLRSFGSQFHPGLRLINGMILGKVVQPRWISITPFTNHMHGLKESLRSSWLGNLSPNSLKLSFFF